MASKTKPSKTALEREMRENRAGMIEYVRARGVLAEAKQKRQPVGPHKAALERFREAYTNHERAARTLRALKKNGGNG